MEALRPKFDLNPAHISTISKELPKPTSVSSKYLTPRKCRVFVPRNSLFRTKSDAQIDRRRESLLPRCSDSSLINSGKEVVESVARGVVGFTAAAAVAAVCICWDSPATAESLTVAFPVSRAREVIHLDTCICLVYLYFFL